MQVRSAVEWRHGLIESPTAGELEMNKMIATTLLCLVSAKATAVQVTLTDVERVENGRSALCVYTGHDIT